MSTAEVQAQPADQLKALHDMLEHGTLRAAHRMVNSMHPSDVALLLESLPPAKRDLVWEFVEPDLEGDVLVEVNDEVRATLIRDMRAEELVAAIEGMEVDDLADLLADLPEAATQSVLRTMDSQDRERLRAVLAYPEDCAGGLMNTDTVTVRPDVTIEVVLRYLRMRRELPDKTDRLFVVDRHDRLAGSVTIGRLVTDDPQRMVQEVMESESSGIPASLPEHEVAKLFENRDLLSAPVVAEDGKLLGRITIDDVVDVIRREADHVGLSMAGLAEEEDLFAGVAKSARRRAIWLGINLATAFLASGVVSLFARTIDRVVALAVLMPIVASMGGIAGTQTVTLIIRGLALGQVQWSNARWLLFKEVGVAVFNGLIWASVVGGATLVFFHNWKIAPIIFAAMVINLLCAAVTGVSIPLLLKRIGVDPALASGVILTTFTDCIGFASLLGLGAAFL